MARDRAPVEFGAELGELTGSRLIVASVQAGGPTIERSAGRPAVRRRVWTRTSSSTVQRRSTSSSPACEIADRVSNAAGSTGLARRTRCRPPRTRTSRCWRSGRAAVAGAYEDREVIDAAHRLACHARAQLRVLAVVKPTLAMYAWTEAGTAIRPGRDIEDIEGEYRALAERELRQAVAGIDDVGIEVSAFVGDPAEVIVELSPRLNLLVCGS